MTTDRWAEIDRLFHAALGRAAADRPAFLERACAGDETIRREVESLLGYQTAAERFLEWPALQDAAEELAGEIHASERDPRVAGYTILKTLGEGGMGIVYLADQLAPIRRRVALKLIKRGMDSRQIVARFESERQALAVMQHPHIAAVFDAGTTGEGRPYFVMEYVDGAPITDYCDRHRLPLRARLQLFADVCAAVQHAHQKGVIHRDLKPSNVLVSDQDGRPSPKIIDFGIAKATQPVLAGRTAFTEEGTLIGTPEYMSPEQAALSADTDTTTDVYSLGVLLYELLVGALPFDSRMLRAAGYDQMCRVIRESDPPKPSSKLSGAGATADAIATARQTDAPRLARHLKGDLDWIALKALEKDRRLRYATVAAFGADVSRFLAYEAVEARQPSAAYRMRKFTRRHRGAVFGALAVLGALVAGLTLSLTEYLRANEARGEAEYRAYAATIAAADGELRLGFAAAARDRLLAVPIALRGWEWQHLFYESDTSLVTLASSTPCARPYDDIAKPLTMSDHALVLRDAGARLYLRRCATLDAWDVRTAAHVAYQMAGRILAVGPTGDVLVVTASAAKGPWGLTLVDPASRRPVASFGPFPAQPMCADISPDGARIGVGLQPALSVKGEPLEDTFETWDVGAPRRLARLTPPRPRLFDTRNARPTPCLVAFSPDSTEIASSGATVHVWRADSGVEVASDATQAGLVSQPIAWSGDGARLAIGRLTGLVDVLDLKSARLDHFDGNGVIRVLPLPEDERRVLIVGRSKNEVLSVAFSPDGARIISGTGVTVGVWSVTQGGLTGVLVGHLAEVIGVAAAPDGRVISADAGGQVKFWSDDQVGAVTRLPGSSSPAERFGLSANGTVVGIGHVDGGVSAWHLDELREVVLRPGSGRFDTARLPRSLAVMPDGRHVLAGELDGTVRSWALDSPDSTAVAMNQIREPGCEVQGPGQSNSMDSMLLSPDGRSVAFKQATCIVVRDWPSAKTLAILRQPSNRSSLAFRSDGALVIVTHPVGPSPDAKIMIWDWRANRVLAQRSAPTTTWAQGWGITTSADGKRIALDGHYPAVVSIWDGNLSRELGRLPVPPETGALAFSPDGRRIATTGSDNAVRIWDADRLQLLLILTDEDHHGGGVAFTPDGRLIAGRSSGGLTIWESRNPGDR